VAVVAQLFVPVVQLLIAAQEQGEKVNNSIEEKRGGGKGERKEVIPVQVVPGPE